MYPVELARIEPGNVRDRNVLRNDAPANRQIRESDRRMSYRISGHSAEIGDAVSAPEPNVSHDE